MSLFKKRFIGVNKIAKIKTTDLLGQKYVSQHPNVPKEHFLFVRYYDKDTQKYCCNVCTHLESKKNNIYSLNASQIKQVKYGNTYPLPYNSATFKFWTGIKKDKHYLNKSGIFKWNEVKFKNNNFKYSDLDNFFKKTNKHYK